MRLPFEHLNLTRNPFGAFDPEERAELAVVDVDEHVDWLATPGRVVEFRGEHGRGKTTHLQAIARRVSDSLYLRVSEQSASLDVGDQRLILVDEGQFLNRRQARRLFSRDRSYAVSTHRALHETYERVGLTSRTVDVGGLDPGILAEIIDRRIEASRRGSGPVPEIPFEVAKQLVAHHGDDIRSIFNELYALFQRLEDVRVVDVAELQRGGRPGQS